MKSIALWTIRFYQRFISPIKGYCCAYRHHTDYASCSTLGFRAVRRFGFIDGMIVLQKRLHLCGVAYRRFAPQTPRPHRHQRGDCDLPCDLPCDSCDAPNLKSIKALDCLDACSCDWPSREKRKKKSESKIYIPPRKLRAKYQ